MSEAELLTEPTFDVAEIDAMPERPQIIPQAGEGMMALRPYQIEAVDSAFEAWRDYDALLMVLATGLGKTVLSADIIMRWPEDGGRVLFVAHMRELIFQARDKIELHTDERPSIEMGIHREGTEGHGILDRSKCLVASIQTLTKRMKNLDPMDFGLIFVDEFHHAGAETYRRMWEYFKTGNPAIKLIGLTATPYRGDNVSLGCIAEHCCFEMGIREGIDEGWLVPIHQKYIVVDQLDFSACRTVAKDLNESDLEHAMMGGEVNDGMTEAERLDALEKQERMLHAVAGPLVTESQGRTTLLFCVTVQHATRMAEVLRRHPGVSAECIFGHTPDQEREDRVKDFKAGRLQILCVVGCATEGFDAPNVQVVGMARPTKKQGLYVQMIGRGTRPLPGLIERYDTAEERQQAIANSLKTACVVLDFVGNSGKHKLISTADVLAGDMPPELVGLAVEELKETGEAADIRDAVWRQKAKRDEEEKRLAALRLAAEEAALLKEEARRAKLKAEAEYRVREIDPFGHEHAPARVQPEYRGGASDKQIAYLRKLGVSEEKAMAFTKGQAGAVIDKLQSKRGGEWIMRFGKHQGQPLNTLPHAYLRWAGENMQNAEFQANLEQYRGEYRQQLLTTENDQ